MFYEMFIAVRRESEVESSSVLVFPNSSPKPEDLLLLL